jgi:hypothetical protein
MFVHSPNVQRLECKGKPVKARLLKQRYKVGAGAGYVMVKSGPI